MNLRYVLIAIVLVTLITLFREHGNLVFDTSCPPAPPVLCDCPAVQAAIASQPPSEGAAAGATRASLPEPTVEKARVRPAQEWFSTLPSGAPCFTNGADPEKLASGECVCRSGWAGDDCGVPSVIQSSYADWQTRFKRRQTPIRVYDCFQFAKEVDMLEIRLANLEGIADYRILSESAWSAHGDPKTMYFELVKDSRMARWRDSIVHLRLFDKPPTATWENENFVRNMIGVRGLPKLRKVVDVSPDDLFIVSDLDELIDRDVVLFLKLYQGYEETLGVSYRWTYYGFFWVNPHRTNLPAICTVRYLTEELGSSGQRVRNTNPSVTLGRSHPDGAGWHCGWCMPAIDFGMKLFFAPSGDGFRFGDVASNYDHEFLVCSRWAGRWFDGSHDGREHTADSQYVAPPYLLANRDRFGYLVDRRRLSHVDMVMLLERQSGLAPFFAEVGSPRAPAGSDAELQQMCDRIFGGGSIPAAVQAPPPPPPPALPFLSLEAAAPPSAPSKTGNCSISARCDFAGGDISHATTDDAQGCCDLCASTQSCTAFAYVAVGKACWLKSIEISVAATLVDASDCGRLLAQG
eukprot:TRINITY_DN6723_c0_g1_i1.p1 TRINITY_DN6723_c0_g1~~TRINITY_DN6723_c0_g1_i1.p1  ORF type:complete len:576 (+),score=169.16 TRINITY_DN6723_c0_g1_i1:102-1829(+)